MLHYHSAVIFVSNINRSKAFYTDLLEQIIVHDFGKNIILKSGISLWEIAENHEINRNLNSKTESNRFELCFETEDIETIDKKLKNKGVEYFHHIKEESWGQRTLRFFDPDNHLIEIGESLPAFILRMYDNGMTINEIEAKTSVPSSTINQIVAK